MITMLAQATEDAATGSAWSVLLMYAVIIGGLFYFLMIRPQRTRMRRHEELVSSLQVNDEVTTIGGIYGNIEYIDDTYAILRVEGGGKLRVARRALAGKVTS